MRNLMQYPVTQEELIQFLDRKIVEERERMEQVCGNMDLTYLMTLKALVEKTFPESYLLEGRKT